MSKKGWRKKFTEAEIAYYQRDRTAWLTKREPEMGPLHSTLAERVFRSVLAEVVKRQGQYDTSFDIDGGDHLKTIQVAYTGGRCRIWSINGGRFMPEEDEVGGFLGHISIMIEIDKAMAGKVQPDALRQTAFELPGHAVGNSVQPGALRQTYDTTRLANELRKRVAQKQLPFREAYNLINGTNPVSIWITGDAESGCITWAIGSRAYADDSSSSWEAIKHALDRAIHGY